MKRFIIKFFILAAMLLGLPMFGILVIGLPVARYLEFPPETQYIKHAPFSWIAFAIYCLFILSVILPLILKLRPAMGQVNSRPASAHSFPWWGWIGIFTGIVAWILAWNRFPWFAGFQPHTFTPLWLSYIVVINALCYRQTGHCMMLDRPWFFLLLFPLSATFWWFFEYLNRFVQNWHYVGAHFRAWEYFWYATLPFSTVLPAVLGTREWIYSALRLENGLRGLQPPVISSPRILAWSVLILAGAGLTGIGIWPDFLFPLLWVSPLLIIVSLQVLMGENQILQDIGAGEWNRVIPSVLAALFCGFFWEMWNFFSLAKWEYSISFVHRFKLFEMPILGYAGYLPFGLECAVIVEMIERIHLKNNKSGKRDVRLSRK